MRRHPSPRRYRLLSWVAVTGVALCVAAVVVLTLLLPSRYSPTGGFLPLPAPTAAGR